jgi:hypothetical protein
MKKKILIKFVLLCLFTTQIFAMGSRRPKPTPAPDPIPTNPTLPPTWSDSSPELDPYEFENSGGEIGGEVDQYYDLYASLNEGRGPASHSVDTCQDQLDGNTFFSNRISFFVQNMLGQTPAKLEGLSSVYKIPSSSSSYKPTGLMTHNLCRVTSTTLARTIKKMPDSGTIARANRFAIKHNVLRTKALNGDYEAKNGLVKHWTKFFSCLAYKESLTTADTQRSYDVSDKYAPSSYSKPEGVKFYEDPFQDEVSRLNIGMFQFTPKASGNVNPCLKAWNQLYPTCNVSTRSSQSSLIKIFGSSLQTFNAFCGVHKLVQTFTVQSHSTYSRYTHPDNNKGGLISAEKRCVTPHFYSGWAYNHFGPLMNSTGTNLKSLMECVDN